MIADQARIESALSYVPAGDRDLWLRIGMAIKAELGEDGFLLWDEWSQRAENYRERDARAVWKSINGSGKVTAGTLYHEAKQRGWKPNRAAPDQTEAQPAAQAKHVAAAERAGQILAAATGEPKTHPYWCKKSVSLGPLLKRGEWPQRGWTDALLVPIYQRDGKVSGIEAINENGDKDTLRDCKKGGGFYPFGKIRGASRVLIGEGIATVAAAFTADASPAAATLMAGNLKTVAQWARDVAAPGADIIILADFDPKPDGSNPGMKAAREAALAVGGFVAVPELDGKKCDFNDLHRARGVEAVRAAIGGAQPVTANSEAQAGDYSVRLIRGSDIKPEPIRWLWKDWLAQGKLHMIAGAPGAGKTTIAMALAATITAGGRWPDGTRAEVGNILIWSGEDDPSDILLPRLLVMGADSNRVYFVADVKVDGKVRPFDPARDMQELERTAASIGDVRLLIVDPIVNAVAGDSHKNTETRRALQPIVELAARLDAAALGVSHFSKGTAGRDPVERVTGSVAFGALPRLVFAAAKTVDDSGNARRMFVRSKSNIGPDGGGFSYDLQQEALTGFPGVFASRVLWGEPLTGQARELLAVAETVEDDRSGTDEAIDWLRVELGKGPVKAQAVQTSARQAGISDKALRRARERLGIKPRKCAFAGGWEWALPGSEDAQDAQDALSKGRGTFGGEGHLREPLPITTDPEAF